MDKKYLIHNIEFTDNPNDQHLTMDLTFDSIDISGDTTPIANVGVEYYINGVNVGGDYYEDVDLSGSGGGGEGINLPDVTITIVSETITALDVIDMYALADLTYGENGFPVYFNDNSPISLPFTFTVKALPVFDYYDDNEWLRSLSYAIRLSDTIFAEQLAMTVVDSTSNEVNCSFIGDGYNGIKVTNPTLPASITVHIILD